MYTLKTTFRFFFLAPIPELSIVNYTVDESVIYLNHSGPYTRDTLGYRVKVTSVDGVEDFDVRNLLSLLS